MAINSNTAVESFAYRECSLSLMPANFIPRPWAANRTPKMSNVATATGDSVYNIMSIQVGTCFISRHHWYSMT